MKEINTDFQPMVNPGPPSRRRVIIWSSILVALVLVVLFAGTGYRAFKGWRARNLARSAEQELVANQLGKALEHARSAYLLAPDETEVLRAVAQTMSAIHDGSAISFWQQLLEKPTITLEDRRQAVDCALAQKQSVLATKWLQALLAMDSKNAKTLLLAAKERMANGDTPGALNFCSEAVQADPKDHQAAFAYAALQAGLPDTHLVGVDALFDLAAGKDAWALNALEVLARMPGLTAGQYEKVVAGLRQHPLAHEPQLIEAWMLEMQLQPGQRSEVLDRAVAAQKNVGPEALSAFCGWLNSIGEFQRVLELVSGPQALKRKDLLLPRLDALAGLKKWDEVQKTLSQPTLPLEDYFVELFRMRCADELGDHVASDLHWQNAQTAAAADPRQSLYLANYMEKLNQPARAQELYRKLIQNPIVARNAFEGLLRISQADGTAAVAGVLEKMAKEWPHDPSVLNDDAYFQLLLEKPPAHARKVAEGLVKDDPNSLPHRTVLALACLRMKDPAAAMQVYEGLNINWAQQSPSNAAVYAATLQANSRDEMAASLRRMIPLEKLRPEERALLETAP